MTAIARLMWKEYRVLRGFWLALGLFGLACDTLIFCLVNDAHERLPGLFGFAGVLPTGFALGAGAMLFALEREESTREFLRIVPATSSRILASKVLTAVAGTLLLALLLLAVTLNDVWDLLRRPSRPYPADEIFLGAIDVTLIYALMVVQAMGWAVFFSLRSARTLLAALLGALGTVTCIGLVHLATERTVLAAFGSSHWAAPALHVFATAAIWSVDIWLGSRWLHGRRIVERARITEVGRFLPYKSLLWQQWRRSRLLLTVVLLLGFLVPLLIWPAFIPTTVLGFALLGACTFLTDQESHHFRFFAQRGVAARRVWISRQLFWLSAALVLALVLFAAHRIIRVFVTGLLPAQDEGRKLWDVLNWVFDLGGYAIWIGLAFGAGQLSSLFFRSGLLAATLGTALAGVLAAWAVLMHTLQISLWWSAAPLIIAMFAATWLRAEGWIIERNCLRAWFPAATVLAVPGCVILALVPAYRVWEIPEPLTTLEVSPSSAPSAEANAAASRLLRLTEACDFQRSDRLAALYHPFEDQPSEQDLTWLTENKNLLDQIIAAIHQLPADASVAGGSPRAEVRWPQLTAMILRSGQVAETGGKLDDAWRRDQSVLLLARFTRRESAVLGEVYGDHLVEPTAMQLLRWGARSGQTADSLRDAIEALRRSETGDGPLADVMLQEYAWYREITDKAQAHPDEWNGKAAFAARWAPWEFTRTRRLLAYVASLNLLGARLRDSALTNSSAYAFFPVQDEHLADARRLWQTTLGEPMLEISLVSRTRQSAVCYRRAAQLALAAEAWRLEHEALPENLAELQGAYFDELPVDPFNNQPFTWLPWGVRTVVQSKNAGEIPAGTPLLYSQGLDTGFPSGQRGLNSLEGARRRSPDDAIVESNRREPTNATSGAAGPFAPQGVPMAPAAAGGAAPSTPAPGSSTVAEPEEEVLEGLVFPLGGALPGKD